MRTSGILVSLLMMLASGAGESLDERRRRLDSLSPTQAAEILDKQKAFERLTPAMKERIRDIHVAVSSDPQAAELDRNMREYCKWLKYLSANKQAEINAMSPTERIAAIKEIMKSNESRHKPEDVRIALRWLDDFITQHASTITEPLLEAPENIPAHFRLRMEEAQDAAPQRFLMYYVHLKQAKLKTVPTPEDFERLCEMLSSNGAREVRAESNDGDRLAKIMRWAFQQSWQMPGEMTADEARYFNKMAESERTKLKSLPRDQFRRKLREIYMNHQFRSGFTSESKIGTP